MPPKNLFPVLCEGEEEVAIKGSVVAYEEDIEEYATIFDRIPIQPNPTCFGNFSTCNLHISTQLPSFWPHDPCNPTQLWLSSLKPILFTQLLNSLFLTLDWTYESFSCSSQ